MWTQKDVSQMANKMVQMVNKKVQMVHPNLFHLFTFFLILSRWWSGRSDGRPKPFTEELFPLPFHRQYFSHLSHTNTEYRYTIDLHTLIIIQPSLRSHKIFWDLTIFYWDLTRSIETSQYLLIWPDNWHLTFVLCHLTFEICHLTFVFNICL